MLISAFGGTDVGRRRDHNEDTILLDQESGIFLVADGMGGHNAGEVASQILAQVVRHQASSIIQMLRSHKVSNEEQRRQAIRNLPKAIEQANKEIYEEARRDPEKRGMGATAVMLTLLDEDVFVCHVGDSRLYLYRDQSLFQVTEDHSLVMTLYKQGLAKLEELPTHPHKNVILRGVGIQPSVEVDTLYLNIMPGDKLLMCSDGLSDMVSEDELTSLMGSYRGQELVEMAIAAANRNGGDDNISVIVLEVEDDPTVRIEPFAQQFGIIEKVDFLRKIFLFHPCTDQELVKVNRVLYQRSYPKDTPIIKQGETGEEFYLVANGYVDVFKGNSYLTTIRSGGHFGELALIDNDARSASVYAGEDCVLFVITRSDFYQLLRADRDLGNKLLWSLVENLAMRVRDLTNRLTIEQVNK